MALLAAMPLAAQDNAAAPASTGDIGPSELSNFSLGGNVTRPADRPAAQPAPAQPAPAASAPAPTPATRAPATTERPRVDTPREVPDPAADILQRRPTLADRGAAASPEAAPPPAALPAPTLLPPAESGFSILPWLAAALAAIGAVVVLMFLRRRSGQERYAGVSGLALGPETAPVQPRPDPVPPRPRHDPVPPPAARKPVPTTLMPKPAPAIPGGVVSTSLRPWIDVELIPDKALLDDQGAAIAFNVTLVNSGSAPARDVTVEALLLNAGNSQDAELSEFFMDSGKTSDPIPMIAPLARVPLRSAVRIARDQIREYEVEGRRLFMPLVAVNTRYRWSSGEGQTGAGFLVGKGQEEADRLAPLRVDQGHRAWRGLGARRYEKGLRR